MFFCFPESRGSAMCRSTYHSLTSMCWYKCFTTVAAWDDKSAFPGKLTKDICAPVGVINHSMIILQIRELRNQGPAWTLKNATSSTFWRYYRSIIMHYLRSARWCQLLASSGCSLQASQAHDRHWYLAQPRLTKNLEWYTPQHPQGGAPKVLSLMVWNSNNLEDHPVRIIPLVNLFLGKICSPTEKNVG